MGIPGIFFSIKKISPSSIQDVQQGETTKDTVQYLYLDANGLLHPAAQFVYGYGGYTRIIDMFGSLSEEEKLQKTFEVFFDKIKDIVDILTPTVMLYIAIDGVAPIAKQNQQRQRRFSSTRKVAGFDPNSLTPGTFFMNRLTLFMNYAIRKEINSNPKWRSFSVLFSPPTVPGEGEHKIMDYIRSIKHADQYSHCFFGPDGDLFMLTLVTHLPKMILLREEQNRLGHYAKFDIGGQLADDLVKYFSHFESGLIRENIVNDFVLCGILVGNDFLPRIQMFLTVRDGIEHIRKAYFKLNTLVSPRKVHYKITNRGVVNINGLSGFIQILADQEEKLLVEQITTSDPRLQPPNEEFVNELLVDNIDVINKNGKPNKITFNYEKYRREYYTQKLLFGDDFERQVELLCENFIQTILWVYVYYSKGIPNWEWVYNYYYPPLMKDLSSYMQKLKRKISPSDVIAFGHANDSQPNFAFEQLLTVLPSSSAGLLPESYAKLMTSLSSPLVLSGCYPTEFKIDCQGKLKEHECIALLNFPDYDLIKREYNIVTSKTRNYTRNKRGEPLIFSYDLTKKAPEKYISLYGTIEICYVIKTTEKNISNFYEQQFTQSPENSVAIVMQPSDAKLNTGGEDAYTFSPDGKMFGIADGVGEWALRGKSSADFSRALMEHLKGCYHQNPHLSAVNQLRCAFENIKHIKHGSSTAVVGILNKTTLDVVNVGDSGMIVIRDGNIIYETEFGHYVGKEQNGQHIPHQLSHATDNPKTTVTSETAKSYKFKVKPNDIVIAATDGLWDNIFDSTVLAVVYKLNPNVLEIAKELVTIAKNNSLHETISNPLNPDDVIYGKPDDITVLVMKYNPVR